jgi:hypothetical protein
MLEVHSVNGTRVRNLAHLVDLVTRSKSDYLKFALGPNNDTVVLDRAVAGMSTAAVLAAHTIPRAMSEGLEARYGAEGRGGAAAAAGPAADAGQAAGPAAAAEGPKRQSRRRRGRGGGGGGGEPAAAVAAAAAAAPVPEPGPGPVSAPPPVPVAAQAAAVPLSDAALRWHPLAAAVVAAAAPSEAALRWPGMAAAIMAATASTESANNGLDAHFNRWKAAAAEVPPRASVSTAVSATVHDLIERMISEAAGDEESHATEAATASIIEDVVANVLDIAGFEA